MSIPVGYAQANFRFTGDAVPFGAEVTLGLNPTLGTDTPAEVAAACVVAWNANIQALLSVSLTFQDVLVKFGPDSTGPSAEAAAGTVGELNSDTVAPNTCALIQKITADGGRAGRGRLYLPGIPEALVSPSGALISGYDTQLTTAFEAFRTDLETANITPVVLHQPGAPITIPSPITSFRASSRVATQRLRNRR